jgi:hypothetical protein
MDTLSLTSASEVCLPRSGDNLGGGIFMMLRNLQCFQAFSD